MRSAPPTRPHGSRTGPGGLSRARSRGALVVALLGLLTLVACTSTGGAREGDTGGQGSQTAAEARRRAQELAPFQEAFGSLQAAVDARDDETAARILARIQARQPRGIAAERARAYGRILDGRALVRSLDLTLECTETADPGLWSVRFRGETSSSEPLELSTAPATLRYLLTGIDPAGFEQRFAESRSVDDFQVLTFAPGDEVVIELGVFELPADTALAVRASWSLTILPGEFRVGDDHLPAMNIGVRGCEAVRLASFLPTEPVEPAELVRYVQQRNFRTPAMLERAVRIPTERRREALELLRPVVEDKPLVEIERLSPALRWLSGQRHIGADARAWKRYLAN